MTNLKQTHSIHYTWEVHKNTFQEKFRVLKKTEFLVFLECSITIKNSPHKTPFLDHIVDEQRRFQMIMNYRKKASMGDVFSGNFN